MKKDIEAFKSVSKQCNTDDQLIVSLRSENAKLMKINNNQSKVIIELQNNKFEEQLLTELHKANIENERLNLEILEMKNKIQFLEADSSGESRLYKSDEYKRALRLIGKMWLDNYNK